MIGIIKLKLNRCQKLKLKVMNLIRMFLLYYRVMTLAINGFCKVHRGNLGTLQY